MPSGGGSTRDSLAIVQNEPLGNARQETAARLRRAAVSLLARREHTRQELHRKLIGRWQRWSQASEAGDADVEDANKLVAEVLDELIRQGLQSDARTAEVLTAARASRWGSRRLGAELSRRGLAGPLVASSLASVQDGERARATALWQRRYGQGADNPADQLRQLRWLIGRGFSPELARNVVRAGTAASRAVVDLEIEVQEEDPDA